MLRVCSWWLGLLSFTPPELVLRVPALDLDGVGVGDAQPRRTGKVPDKRSSCGCWRDGRNAGKRGYWGEEKPGQPCFETKQK